MGKKIDKQEVETMLTEMHDKYMLMAGWIKDENGKWQGLRNVGEPVYVGHANAIHAARSFLRLM